MFIGICDDDNIMRERLERVCKDVTKKYNEETIIKKYKDGQEITDQNIDILILDIEMPMVGGIAVKERLENAKSNTVIIFATSHEEMMAQAFGVNVIGFVTKKYIEDQLPVVLERALKIVRGTVLIEGIDSRNIEYIKSEHIYCNLYLTDGQEFLLRESMKALEDRLEAVGFIKIFRGCLVNMEQVEEMKNGKVYMHGGTVLQISSRLKASVEKKYTSFCIENARFC